MTIELAGTVVRGDLTLTIDISVGAGPIAIVGPNGAGKTTLLRVVAGLDGLDHGSLRIDGTEVDCGDDRRSFVPTHERSVAMCFQEPRLLRHRSALDNVALGARRSLSSRAAHAEAVVALRTVGGVDPNTRVADLSGGQLQRVALARALVVPTRVLLLDEPLASVDDASRRELRSIITAIDDRPVLWVTHDPVDADGLPTVLVDNGQARVIDQTGSS